jgi:hypothetical protein
LIIWGYLLISLFFDYFVASAGASVASAGASVASAGASVASAGASVASAGASTTGSDFSFSNIPGILDSAVK